MVLLSLVVLLGLLGASWAVSRALDRVVYTLRDHLEGMDLRVQDARIREIEDAVDRLPAKWTEMVEQASRAEGRTRAIVQRARRELAESGIVNESVEGEAAQLRLIDEDGGGGEEMPAVRRSVAYPSAQAQPPAPDWETLTRQKKFGGR